MEKKNLQEDEVEKRNVCGDIYVKKKKKKKKRHACRRNFLIPDAPSRKMMVRSLNIWFVVLEKRHIKPTGLSMARFMKVHARVNNTNALHP